MSSLYKRFHRGIFRDYREVLRLYSLQRMFNAIFHKGKEKGARRRRRGGGGGGKKIMLLFLASASSKYDK